MWRCHHVGNHTWADSQTPGEERRRELDSEIRSTRRQGGKGEDGGEEKHRCNNKGSSTT